MSGGTKSTKSNSTTSATTTPNVPSWAAGPVENYFGQVGGLISQNWNNPNFLATEANSLQQAAANNAANLPSGQGELNQSNAFATQAGNAAPGSYTGPKLGPIAQMNQVSVNGASLGPAAQAALAQAQAAQAGPSASLLDNFSDYANPVTDELVTKNLGALSDAQGQNTAAFNNQVARLGAFGGSRAGVAQAQLASQQAKDQGLMSAELRNNAFNQQANLANLDTNRRQETSLFNTANQQQTNLANAGFANQNNQFNTGQTNDFAQTQASFNQQAAMQQAQINAQQEAMRFQAENERGLAQAGFDAQGGMFNANLGQQQLDRTLAAGGLLSNNAQAGAGIANQNAATQANIGQSMWDIDRYNNGAGLLGQAGLQGLLSGYEPFVGQTINGTETGTQTQKSSGGLLGKIGSAVQLAGSAASLFSDRRLKTKVERVGELEDGLGVYEYDYVWGGTRQRGVMADEVAKLRPWALGPVVEGFATVNYGAL